MPRREELAYGDILPRECPAATHVVGDWSLSQRFGTPLGSALAGETYDVELSLPSGDYRLRVDSFNHFVVAVRVR